MKAKVITAYTDKHTGDIHLAGEVVELTAERAGELESLYYVVPLEEPAKKTPARRKAAPKKAE